jgi:hypothetical protein
MRSFAQVWTNGHTAILQRRLPAKPATSFFLGGFAQNLLDDALKFSAQRGQGLG